MYNIDINFLKDRKLDSTGGTTAFQKKPTTPLSERVPIFIGTGVGVAFIAAVGGALVLLNGQKSSTNNTIAELDAEIQRLQGQNQQVQQIQTEIDNVNRETGILASVFNNIKPWSAMLAEIAYVTPPSVQINSITQNDTKTLTINGYAQSYDDVNDFLLTLKNSPFLNGENTRLTTSSLTDNPSTVIFDRAQLNPQTQGGNGGAGTTPTPGGANTGIQLELPQVILYTITSEISDLSSEQLLNLLNRRGAIGLVSRLSNLQRKGVLQLESVAEETQEQSEEQEGEAQQ